MKQICATCAYFIKLGKSITYCSCKKGDHYGSTYYTSSHTPKCEDYKCRYIVKGVPIKNGNPRGKDNNKKQLEDQLRISK